MTKIKLTRRGRIIAFLVWVCIFAAALLLAFSFGMQHAIQSSHNPMIQNNCLQGTTLQADGSCQNQEIY